MDSYLDYWWPWLMGIVFGFCIGWDPEFKNIHVHKEDVKRVWAKDFCGNDDCKRIVGNTLETSYYQNHKPE
jgi:hypothetical protein